MTVQLDGLGRQLAELAAGEPGRPESTDGPVFVDESGRRSKTYRRVGWVLAAVCAVYAVTLVVAVLGGNSTAPWLPISGQEDGAPAEVEVQPAPTGRADSVTDTTPEADPTASGSAVASPGSVRAPGATAPAPTVPGAGAPASSSVAPPLDGGSVTTSASPSASAPVSPVAGSPSVDESPPPAGESPLPPAETTVPPVQEQEGAP